MKAKISRFSGQYLKALQNHFEQGSPASLQAAHELGTQAVAIGLETLDLARIHDQALATQLLPDCSSSTRDDMTTSAAIFFNEAVLPIEETHRIALEADADLNHLNATLDQLTLALADSNRELQQQITGRQTAEAALKTSEWDSSQLLKESRLLEKHLQDMARKILSAHEEERKRMSLLLHDEIAQTLLGIHVRLLTLKKEAVNQTSFIQEIAITQRLVEQSEKTINHLAREFSIQQT